MSKLEIYPNLMLSFDHLLIISKNTNVDKKNYSHDSHELFYEFSVKKLVCLRHVAFICNLLCMCNNKKRIQMFQHHLVEGDLHPLRLAPPLGIHHPADQLLS